MESSLCFLRYLLLNLEAAAFRVDDARGFLFVRLACFSATFPWQWRGRPSLRVRRRRPEILEICENSMAEPTGCSEPRDRVWVAIRTSVARGR